MLLCLAGGQEAFIQTFQVSICFRYKLRIVFMIWLLRPFIQAFGIRSLKVQNTDFSGTYSNTLMAFWCTCLKTGKIFIQAHQIC
jgi:hypothetical protein